tara:strand:- start:191 stop:1054 length:864 start_codon:yes stop_codon:yes gene_type:complete
MNINSPLSHRKQEPENSVLYLVATPIGNLNDISLRALQILKNVSLIACEDTRQTKKLMNKFEIKNNTLSFNEHNASSKIPIIINKLKLGNSIALVSDAGMPSICDPGENLVREVRRNNIDVICIPGPCAATTALVASGLPSSSFIFKGFLPRKKIEREKVLFEISNHEKTIILFESPNRVLKLMMDLKKYCGGEREIRVFRELTKKYEEQIGDNINMVLNLFENRKILGEITIVIKGINKKEKLKFDKLLLKKELNELIDAGLSLSAASKYLAKKNNLKKNTIYSLR